MAKIVRDAALVLGAVALAATGVGLAADAAVGLGGVATIGGVATATISSVAGFSAALAGGLASILQKKPSQPANPMAWQSDPNAGLPIIAGRAFTSGKIFLRTVSGDNDEAESIHTAYSIGPIKGFEQLYIDSIARSIDGSGNASVPDYGKVVIATQLGAQPEASAFGFWDSTPGLTATSKVSGIAAAAIRLYYDTKGKNTMTTEPQIGFVVNGVRVYDPRQDSTYPGGAANGTQRWNDETTWSYVGYDNPYLFAIAWLIGWRQNGKLVAGVGMPVSAIILDQFVEGANVADANGWKMGGELDTTDNKWNRLKDILQAGGGMPMRLGAQVGCIVSTPKTSLATITIDDVVGDASVQATQAQKDRINSIIPRYMAELDNTVVDPSQPADSEGNYKLITNVTWTMVAASPVVVSDYVTFDGKQRQKQVDYAFVQNLTQAVQLARYDIENAREFGPISLPLKLRWMGYKPGDVVTCNLPELGLVGQDILILQRELSPQDLTVTMTAQSETPAKHAYALGQTGTAPATPSVWVPKGPPAAPLAASWTAQGAQLSNLGTSTPIIEVTGVTDNATADAVILEYRVSQVLGTADGSDLATASGDTIEVSAPGPWLQAGIFAPTVTGMQIAQVASGETYDVAISYRVRGVIGAQLIIPSVQAGLMVTPGSLALLIATSAPSSGLSITAAADANGTTATISISAHQRIYSDKTVNVNAGTVSGVPLSAYNVVFYDDPTRAGGAVAYQASTNADDALLTADHPARHYDGYVTTPAAGATSASSGGAASGPGGVGGGSTGCPEVSEQILLANADRTGPGGTVAAIDLTAGERWVWTRHEHSGEWGAFRVTSARLIASEIYAAPNRPRCSPSHQFIREDLSIYTMADVGRLDGRGTVVAIEVEDAHTYVVGGWLSHNKTTQQAD